MKRWALVILTLALGLVAERNASANAVVRGAYYRLGDDDPGAAPSLLGNNPTKDSFSDALDLTRFGRRTIPPMSPHAARSPTVSPCPFSIPIPC